MSTVFSIRNLGLPKMSRMSIIVGTVVVILGLVAALVGYQFYKKLTTNTVVAYFPEALALKRQCVIHGKPFLSTVASARDWVEMERVHAGLAPDRQADRFHDHGAQTLALIAHDAMKATMLDFAARNFDLLSRFGRRVATGTTGQRLNELAWNRGWPADQSWVDRFNSGPLGGDAQIADLVLERRCQRAIFFEDPHVARQHEADIQLLERAVATATHDAVCTTSPRVAQRWCDAALLRARAVER